MERLWVRVAATGVVEAEEEDVLLEAELMPEVSGDDWEVDSQNCGDGTISRGALASAQHCGDPKSSV